MRDDRTWYMTYEDSETGVKKDWIATNSGSVGISGGSALLKEVKERFNSFLAIKRYYYLPEEYTVYNYDTDKARENHIYNQRYKLFNNIDVATNEPVDNLGIKPYRTAYNTYLTYNEISESTSDSPSVRSIYDKNVRKLESEEIILTPEFDEEGNYLGTNTRSRNNSIKEGYNSLLNKTNELFKSRKIESIIARYYTDSAEGPRYSRGRNLRKEDGQYGNSFVSPYCRV